MRFAGFKKSTYLALILSLKSWSLETSRHPLYLSAVQMGSPVTAGKISYFLGQQIDSYLDENGRLTPELQQVLFAIEKDFLSEADVAARKSFQRLVAYVGGEVRGPRLMPEDDTPYWTLHVNEKPGPDLQRKLRRGQNGVELDQQFPFAEFHSTPALPIEADVIIVGGGLTGATAAYYLSEAAKKGLRVLLLEDDLKKSASFRNGGNFEAMPESFLGDYEGLVREREKYLRLTRPGLSEAQIVEQGAAQAEWILKWCAANAQHLMNAIENEGIQALASPNGWVRIAESASEDLALQREVLMAKNLGLEFEYWSPEQIKKELGIDARFGARRAVKSGNYHPGRYVTQMLRLAESRGVQLHTRTRVQKIVPQSDGTVNVLTARGMVHAKKVIVATNAFTRDLFPELAAAIHPFQSHIANWEHLAIPTEKDGGLATWTWNLGDGYGHFRWETVYLDGKKQRRGMFHVGGGRDLPIDSPHFIERREEIFRMILANMEKLLPETKGRPPSRFWTGPMGFTPDRVPLVGPYGRGIILAAGYNGYGGSWALQSAFEAAQFALNGEGSSLYNADYLSPLRFREGRVLNPLRRAFANDDSCAVKLANPKGLL